MPNRILLLLALTATPCLGRTSDVATPTPAVTAHDVVMYALPECPYCVKARAYFRAHGIAWREFDIAADADAAARFKALGGLGTPLLLIDGQRIAGFDEPRIAAALAHAAAPSAHTGAGNDR